MLVSDNGASENGVTGTQRGAVLQRARAAGGQPQQDRRARRPTTFNHYPWWTWAEHPFRRWKRETYRGERDPFLVHWPAGINAHGELRDQYAHIIDVIPTVLDALGIEPPATIKGVTQAQPIHGVSFAPTSTTRPPDRRRRGTSRCSTTRSIDHDGWRAVCPWRARRSPEAGKPFGTPITPEILTDLDARHWELYHVAEATRPRTTTWPSSTATS